jgi:hypothetical protein
MLLVLELGFKLVEVVEAVEIVEVAGSLTEVMLKSRMRL